MAEKKNNDGLPGDETSITAEGEKGERPDLESGEQTSSSGTGRGKTRAKSGRIKWVLLILFGIVLAASGITIKLEPGFFIGKKNKAHQASDINMNDDNLSEQELSPFFIPPSEENKKGPIRIDLSVVWDGLASVRFMEKKLLLRSQVYDRITEMAKQSDDLNKKITVLENVIASIFRKGLGVHNLAIRIKEIKYF